MIDKIDPEKRKEESKGRLNRNINDLFGRMDNVEEKIKQRQNIVDKRTEVMLYISKCQQKRIEPQRLVDEYKKHYSVEESTVIPLEEFKQRLELCYQNIR